MRGAVVVRPRWRSRVVEVHGYRHRMEDRVRPSVRDEVQVRPQHGRFDGQRDVEGATVVQGEDWHSVRGRWPLGAGRWWRAGLYPLGGEPLLDGALELVIGRLAAGGRRRAMRMVAVITVVAHDHRRRYDTGA